MHQKEISLMFVDIEELQEFWNTLYICYEHPEKYITEALLPIANFRSYKAFDNITIKEFYLVLRATITRAQSVGLLKTHE